VAVTASPFVGRKRELAELRELLEDARRGAGAVAMLSGEPGIGKTTTARAFADLADGEGFRVLWGTCYEGESSAPFGPWVQAVAPALRDVDLDARFGPTGAVLAELVPIAGEALPQARRPAPLASDEARLRAYEAFAHLLAALADERVVVVLDDLQWADPASLGLLGHFGRVVSDAPIVLVGTYREAELELTHPLGQALAELDRQVRIQRVRLGVLDVADVRTLLAAVADGPVSREFAEKVARETGGNPFFVSEVALQLAAARAPIGEIPIPDSVRQAIGQRLARLSEETARVLSLAAAFAGPFRFDALGALTDLDEDTLLNCIDEALGARMLIALESERYEFAHALVRHAIYDELSPSRQARLHRRIAEALERLGGRREAAELASQYYRSRTLPGAEHGVGYAMAAAEQARQRYAYEQAVVFLRMAQELAVESDESLRADIASRLAEAQAEALMLEEARESAEEALALLDSSGAAHEDRADFARKVAWALDDASAPRETVQPFVDRGLSYLGERRDLVWARLKLAEYPLETSRVDGVIVGRWLGFDPHAVQIARAEGDERDYAKSIELMDWRSRAEVDDLLTTVETWTDAAAKIHGLSVVVRSLLIQHGDVLGSQAVAQKLLGLSTKVGSIPGQAYALAYLMHAAEALGDFEGRQALSTRAHELIDVLGPGHRLHSGIATRGPIFVDLDFGEIGRTFWSFACAPSSPPWMGLVHAAAAAEFFALAGAAEESRRILELVLPAIVRSEPTTLNHNGAVAAAIGAAWELGEAAPAAALKKCVVDLRAAGVGGQQGMFSSLELAGGRAAALLGKRAEARSFFAEARERLEAQGLRPLRAIVDLDEARALLRWGEPGASPLVETARRQFEAIGMTYWLERADALKERIEQPYPDGLTRREVEILRRIAAGESNKEVAAALVLSVHTVERHVANFYRKIGARNRAEATAYALRERL
jgi:DNA-binding CsgD family transcriptional regulator